MKNIMAFVVGTLWCVMGLSAQPTWTVDKAHSNVKFTVSHLVISEVDGSFRVYSGTLRSQGSDFSDADVEFAVDVNSIETGNDMRDNHLKSDEFFSAQRYPTMQFRGGSWKKVGDGNYLLEGDLTIRNVTRRVAFKVTHGGITKDGYGNTKAGFKATTTINRCDYGLKWNALTEAGGTVVGKDVNVTLNLQFTAKESS
jgi:polyisoprenoid-binding protein YceI